MVSQCDRKVGLSFIVSSYGIWVEEESEVGQLMAISVVKVVVADTCAGSYAREGFWGLPP